MQTLSTNSLFPHENKEDSFNSSTLGDQANNLSGIPMILLPLIMLPAQDGLFKSLLPSLGEAFFSKKIILS